MKIKKLLFTAALCGLFLPAAAPVHAAAWTATDLGTLGGATRVTALNESGQVVGYSVNAAGNKEAFVYRNGAMQRLGTGGALHSYARGINDLGDIVGEVVYSNRESRPVIMRGGVTQVFGPGQGAAYDINNAGVVVGWWGSTSSWYNAAVVYRDGLLTRIIARSSPSHATRVNEAGDVVGGEGANYEFGYELNGFVYRNGAFTRLVYAQPPIPRQFDTALDINDAGQGVGTAETDYQAWSFLRHALAYTFSSAPNATKTILPGLAAYGNRALGINNAGDIVGGSEVDYTTVREVYEDVTHAVLWRGGQIVDLNTLIPHPSGRSDVYFRLAVDINDAGQIIAEDNAGRAWLLTPPVAESSAVKLRARNVLSCVAAASSKAKTTSSSTATPAGCRK